GVTDAAGDERGDLAADASRGHGKAVVPRVVGSRTGAERGHRDGYIAQAGAALCRDASANRGLRRDEPRHRRDGDDEHEHEHGYTRQWHGHLSACVSAAPLPFSVTAQSSFANTQRRMYGGDTASAAHCVQINSAAPRFDTTQTG